jgi:hypothetical protein
MIAELLDERAESTPVARPTLLRADELSHELGVSERTIDRLRNDGMPTVWVAQSPRFCLPAVLSWLESRGQP